MASTPAKTVPPGITTAIDLTCVKSAFEAARERRRAYTLGFKQNEAALEEARHQAERWEQEAKFWKSEHDHVFDDFCKFVSDMADKFGVK